LKLKQQRSKIRYKRLATQRQQAFQARASNPALALAQNIAFTAANSAAVTATAVPLQASRAFQLRERDRVQSSRVLLFLHSKLFYRSRILAAEFWEPKRSSKLKVNQKLILRDKKRCCTRARLPLHNDCSGLQRRMQVTRSYHRGMTLGCSKTAGPHHFQWLHVLSFDVSLTHYLQCCVPFYSSWRQLLLRTLFPFTATSLPSCFPLPQVPP